MKPLIGSLNIHWKHQCYDKMTEIFGSYFIVCLQTEKSKKLWSAVLVILFFLFTIYDIYFQNLLGYKEIFIWKSKNKTYENFFSSLLFCKVMNLSTGLSSTKFLNVIYPCFEQTKWVFRFVFSLSLSIRIQWSDNTMSFKQANGLAFI